MKWNHPLEATRRTHVGSVNTHNSSRFGANFIRKKDCKLMINKILIQVRQQLKKHGNRKNAIRGAGRSRARGTLTAAEKDGPPYKVN